MRERDATISPRHQLRTKLLGIIRWRDDVDTELDPPPPPRRESPLAQLSPLQLPLDDLDSLPTDDDSLVITPPTRSVIHLATAALVLEDQVELKHKWFGDFTTKLRNWRTPTMPDDDFEEPSILTPKIAHIPNDELLPVGIEAANFYSSYADDDYPDDLHPRGVAISRHGRSSSFHSDSASMPIQRGRPSHRRQLR